MLMSDLPPDLVEEILSRVPATSLKALRSSCKQWNTLFKDPRFTEKHFGKAPRQSHVTMLKEFMFCPVNVDLNVVPPLVEFKDEVKLKDFHISDIFHCDGLLLCTTTDRRLMVWNPCLGETRWIQYKERNERFSIFALGYLNTKSGRSYKIMRCWTRYRYSCCETNGPVVETYEFSSDSWRVLDDVTLDRLPHGCVSIKGNTYWANPYTTDDFLFCFDFTKERVKRMCLPQFQYSGCNVLSVVGEEKLALLHLSKGTISKMDMWVTDKIDTDTEAALTWRKSFTVDESDYVPFPMSFVLDEEKEVALCCTGSEISELMVYTLGENDNSYRVIPHDEEFMNTPFILKYVPSLVQIYQ